MKISVEWLNQYLEKPLTARAMADAMELAGIEVEEVVGSINLDSKIITGKVLTVKPHPNADRLRLAEVDVNKSTLVIVCGASNLEVGQAVVVAQIGAELPDGTVIKATEIRDQLSYGMLCSPSELGLSDDHSGIMVLPAETGLGQSVSEVIGSDELIDISTAANRWDLNSYAGIATEVAAHSHQNTFIPMPASLSTDVPLIIASVSDAKLSPRYMLAKLSVNISQPTPVEIKQRLIAVGMRSISPVVDITNYVMLEYGQPLHAFDADKVKGGVQVRAADKNEVLITLDNQKRTLTPDDIVIADDSGAIGLAGVMGGAETEITPGTTTVLLEAASFPGITLRQTAQRFGLRSDASSRFERGIPTALPPVALARTIELLTKHAGAKLIAGPAEIGKPPKPQTAIAVSAKRMSAFLGIKLSAIQITTELTRLNFATNSDSKDQDLLKVTPPKWRNDVSTDADVAEEVIKLIGYNQLPATIPSWKPTRVEFDDHWAPIWKAKAALQASGLFELTNYSFISEDQITDLGWEPNDFLKLKNPLSREQAYLRRELLPSLIAVAERNRNYSKSFGLYELSKVYQPSRRGELPHEPQRLIVMTVGLESYRWAKAVLDRLIASLQADAKLTVKPATIDKEVVWPGRSAEIVAGKSRIGVIAQLHPTLAKRHKLTEAAYFDIDWLSLTKASGITNAPLQQRFPAVSRDIAFIIDRVITWQQVKTSLANYQVEFVSDYYGNELPAGKKVLALRATFRSSDRTLTDSEADLTARAILKKVVQNFKAQPR